MTLLPVEPVRITVPEQEGWMELERYQTCQMPTCQERPVHTHEIVRRSYTAGPKAWVAIDGLVLCNQVRLCFFCHADVTEHRAWIRYLTGEGWLWYAATPAGAAGLVAPGHDILIQHPKSLRSFRLIGPLKGA